MNSIRLSFQYPWLLILLLPIVALAFRPYLMLPPKSRRMKNRVVSLTLHIIVLVLLVLLSAGINFKINNSSIKSDIIILVDRSTSNQMNRDEVNSIVKSILDESPETYKIGIVEFAKDSIYTVKMDTNKINVYDDFINSNFDKDQSATDINQALAFAYDKLDNPENGRIVIVSDGRQTDGNAFTTARTIANEGTRIDVFYVSPANVANDALIKTITIQADPELGAETDIRVTVSSNLESNAVLALTYTNIAGEVKTQTEDITLVKGENEFYFTQTFLNYGLTEIIAELLIESPDAIEENNKQYAFVNIADNTSNKVLIIEGVFGESKQVENLLLNSGFEVDVLGINNLPTSTDAIMKYRSIITMNIKNSDLVASGFQAVLEPYVKSYGGGLLTIGGNRAYQNEDMNGDGVDSTFADLLPIEASTDPKAMAVVIVMDASSSMTSNNSTRLDVAKLGAIASLEALAAYSGETSHQFGVVTFDANLKDVIDMTSVDNIDIIIPQIESIQSGYGTRYTDGLLKAVEMLSAPSLSNSQKHIIFLTDGGPQDNASQYMAVINSMTDISVTTISLGIEGENNLDSSVVENMVRNFNGRGSFYRVTNQNQLQAVMLEDTEQAQSGDFINEVPFTGIINTVIPELARISTMPELQGYYGTRAKIDANVIIQTEDGDPLFAIWNPADSIGRVASFTSDLSGEIDSFSETFIDDFIGKAFIEGMVFSVSTISSINSSDITVGYIDENYKTSIIIRTNMDDGDTIISNVTNPNGDVSRVSLSSISKTTFSGDFTSDIPGTYKLEVTRYNNNSDVISSTTSYSAFSYSSEYDKEFDEEETIIIMEEIAANGTYLYRASDMFGEAQETISKEIDIRSILVIVAILLFLTNIVIRKFNFKWSHQYFGKKFS